MPPVSWLRALGDERSKDVLRSVAVGYLNEPDSLDLLFDQVVRMRAKTDAEAEGETDTPAETDENAEAASAEDAESPREAGDGEVPAAFRREQPRRRLPATVYLHLDRETQTWSMDGVGPISRAEAAEIVGHSHVTVKPVIDLAANLTYTGYVAPPRLREQTALRNAGYCTFPSCNRTAPQGRLRPHVPQRGPAGRSYLVTAGSTTRLDQHRRRRTNAA